MELSFRFVSIALAIILGGITVFLTVKEIMPFRDMTAETQQKYNTYIDDMREERFDDYNNTIIPGAEVLQIVSSSQDLKLGILVEIHDGIRKGNGNKSDLTEANISVKSLYNFGEQIGVDADDLDNFELCPYLHYQDSDTPIDEIDVFKTDKSLASCKFSSKLIKDLNGTILGIYFKQEE